MTFLKVGSIGFGGGSALIPIVEKEVVQKRSWFDEAEFLRHVLIANLTPGAMPVKLGAATGLDLRGGRGAWTGAMASALPGVVLMSLMMTLFSLIGDGAVRVIEMASVGISVFIVLVLVLYIEKALRASSRFRLALRITILSFLLSGGKEIRQMIATLADIDFSTMPPSVFNLSSIDLILVALFLVFFLGHAKGTGRWIAGTLVAGLYAMAKGDNGWIPDSWHAGPILLLVMALVILLDLAVDSSQRKSARQRNPQVVESATRARIGLLRSARPLALFLIVPAALVGVACILFPSLLPADSGENHSVLAYAGLAAASTATSFGGGEAYVPVAEGFFVQTGFITADAYFTQIVSVANALPGPILVKIASAIGYQYGYGATGGNLLAAWLLALIGLSVTVGVSSVFQILLLGAYDRMADSPRLKLLKAAVIPVVCGMLVPTALSLLFESMKIVQKYTTMPGGFGLLALSMGFLGLLFLSRKCRLNDGLLIVGAALTSGLLLSIP
jgi:chromate transporter